MLKLICSLIFISQDRRSAQVSFWAYAMSYVSSVMGSVFMDSCYLWGDSVLSVNCGLLSYWSRTGYGPQRPILTATSFLWNTPFSHFIDVLYLLRFVSCRTYTEKLIKQPGSAFNLSCVLTQHASIKVFFQRMMYIFPAHRKDKPLDVIPVITDFI